MTRTQAMKKAARIARQRKTWIWVVFEDREVGFQIATDFDMETHFAGFQSVAGFGPDGRPA